MDFRAGEIHGIPVRLIIPSINVDTNVQRVGVTPEGEMGVPTNTYEAGWYELGPRPGQRGSAVIAGHLNGLSGEAGVFADLGKLKEGDKVYVEDEVFTRSDSTYLNLITCDGLWDETKKSYGKRLVVFADIAN